MEGSRKAGDQVAFDFLMEPCYYQADYRVREDIGKVALMKGPVVYCAEEADNGKNLHLFCILPEEKVREGKVQIGGQEFPALYAKALKEVLTSEHDMLYRRYEKAQYEPTEIQMIPYAAWANRGENEMMVWLPQFRG